MSEKLTLFHNEEEIIKQTANIIKQQDIEEQPLLQEYKNLFEAYAKLLNQSKKLLKVGDAQQKKLTTQQKKLAALTNTLESNNVKLQQQNELIHKVFGRYLSDEIVETLFETEAGLDLGGECHEITILTSDIRGFTAQVNHLSPTQVIKILNLYLATMADVISKYQGTINNFMGDGILVLFGAPIIRADDPERAIACAVAMQLAMENINEEVQAWGFTSLEMGIGINTGEVVVGNIGSEKRTHYTAIGNNVNLAYRIEGYTVGGQIMISKSTLKRVGDIVKINAKKLVTPKGIKQATTIYEVGGIGGKNNLYLHNEEEIFIPLQKNIQLTYQVLEDKQIQKCQFSGHLIKMSAKKALIHCEAKKALLPKSLSNLKIKLIIPNAPTNSDDIYAKVLGAGIGKKNLYICFTNMSIDVRTQLVAMYKVKWTSDLSINYQIIDKQHQQLFKKLQELVSLAACYKKEEIVETISLFEEHVIKHFETEECLMQQHNYSDYAAHKAQHLLFMNRLNEFKQKHEQTPNGLLYLVLKIQQKLLDWWLSHIDNYDKQLGRFLLELI